ncbi:hypothetical protein N7541_012062 [Penicillium brevicompactum]|uniref:Uncharacterized protein n=1 Tax=Penicillium brevicompactum TaxID=5074 RepID=A0A9W9QXH5_PENBR|nr:hypothetical protein N7541_012062 [Penicillium brevicompactum]
MRKSLSRSLVARDVSHRQPASDGPTNHRYLRFSRTNRAILKLPLEPKNPLPTRAGRCVLNLSSTPPYHESIFRSLTCRWADQPPLTSRARLEFPGFARPA